MSREYVTMPGRPDWFIGVGFALLGAVLGATVLHQSSMLYFYQAFMPEMVYSACGHGFVRSPVTPPPMVDFLFGRSSVFDCATIGIAPEEPAGFFFRAQLYLGWAVSALWRMTSIRYANLWPLVSALVGAYACGCFVLVRLFFARWPAVAGAGLLALSPVMLSMVPYFRDFSKAPFFIWAIAFLILTMRAELPRMALLWAALSGVTIGLGVGFRSDIFILLANRNHIIGGLFGTEEMESRRRNNRRFRRDGLVFCRAAVGGRNGRRIRHVADARPVRSIPELSGFGACAIFARSALFGRDRAVVRRCGLASR
ncbi:hypothetical protein ACVWXN_001568 [Bradyrhizobium sp. i1.4.4]